MFKLKYDYLRLLPLFNSGGTDGHLRSSLQKKDYYYYIFSFLQQGRNPFGLLCDLMITKAGRHNGENRGHVRCRRCMKQQSHQMYIIHVEQQ